MDFLFALGLRRRGRGQLTGSQAGFGLASRYSFGVGCSYVGVSLRVRSMCKLMMKSPPVAAQVFGGCHFVRCGWNCLSERMRYLLGPFVRMQEQTPGTPAGMLRKERWAWPDHCWLADDGAWERTGRNDQRGVDVHFAYTQKHRLARHRWQVRARHDAQTITARRKTVPMMPRSFCQLYIGEQSQLPCSCSRIELAGETEDTTKTHKKQTHKDTRRRTARRPSCISG